MRNFNSILFAVTSLITIGISIPLILKKVPPNEIYGFRTAKTLSNERVWYAANRFSGWTLLAAGAVSLILVAILHYNPQMIPNPKQYGFILTAVFVVPVIIAIIVSFIYVQKL